jgi:hypothetical protein
MNGTTSFGLDDPVPVSLSGSTSTILCGICSIVKEGRFCITCCLCLKVNQCCCSCNWQNHIRISRKNVAAWNSARCVISSQSTSNNNEVDRNMLDSKRNIFDIGLRIYSLNVELEHLSIITESWVNDLYVSIVSRIN